MHHYYYFGTLTMLFQRYDPFSRDCHQAEATLALFVERNSVEDYIFTPVSEGI